MKGSVTVKLGGFVFIFFFGGGGWSMIGVRNPTPNYREPDLTQVASFHLQ